MLGLFSLADHALASLVNAGFHYLTGALGIYVAKYFEDTIQHIRSLKEVLKPGAQVHYVVGNSKFYDVMLHTEQIYAAIFEHEGFRNVRIRVIRKRTSKKELFEYVVSAEM